MHPLYISFLCVFALIKKALCELPGVKRLSKFRFGRKIIAYISAPWAVLTVITASNILIPFVIIKKILEYLLTYWYRDKFGGFLDGISRPMEASEERTAIFAVFLIDGIDDIKEFHLQFFKRIKKMHESVYQLSSIVRTCFGYHYYLKNQIKFEQVIRKVFVTDGEDITLDDLLKYLQNCKVTPRDQALWEVKLFPQRIKSDDDGDQMRHAIALRINHCITDGFFMIPLLRRFLFDYKPILTNTKKELKIKSPNLNLEDVYINTNPASMFIKNSVFKGGDKVYLSTFLEKTPKYTEKIKRIKNLLGISFTDVLLGCLAASLTQFLKETAGKTPRRLNLLVSGRVKIEEIIELMNGSFNANTVSNGFSMLQFQTSTHFEKYKLIESLRKLGEESDLTRKSIDVLLSYYMVKYVCEYIPLGVLNYFSKKFFKIINLTVTNLAAIEEEAILNHRISNVFAYSSVYTKQGIFMCVGTYGGRLQVALVAREEFLRDQSDLQNVLNCTFEYIDFLDSEIDCTKYGFNNGINS